MINSYDIVRAFQKNCPGVRMTKDEIEELGRLIFKYGKYMKQRGIDLVKATPGSDVLEQGNRCRNTSSSRDR